MTATSTSTNTPRPPELEIAKTTRQTAAHPGQPLVYTVWCSNTGGQTATGVKITETVPGHTTFLAALSDPRWSCADGSPAGTKCLFDVGDVPPETEEAVIFAVMVDQPAGTKAIVNTVRIEDSEGELSEDTESTPVLLAAPAPVLSGWAWLVSLTLLIGIAVVQLRRRRRSRDENDLHDARAVAAARRPTSL